jgi:hypothetical protein
MQCAHAVSDWRRKLVLVSALLLSVALAPFFAFELLGRYVLRDVTVAPLARSDASMFLQDALWLEAGERRGAGVDRAWLGNLLPREHYVQPSGFRVAWLLARQKPAHRLSETFFMSVWLTRHATAPELESAYAATAYFGRGAHGFHVASRRYFGKTPGELTLAESATLIGQPQRPSRDPYCDPDYATQRRAYVLKLMTHEALISSAAAIDALEQPVVLLPIACSPRTR